MDAHAAISPRAGSQGGRVLCIVATSTVPFGLLLLGLHLLRIPGAVGFASTSAVLLIAATAVLRFLLSDQAPYGLSWQQRFAIWVAPAVASMLTTGVVAMAGAHIAAACLAALLLVAEAVSWHWLSDDASAAASVNATPATATYSVTAPTLYTDATEHEDTAAADEAVIEADIEARLAARFTAEASAPELSAEDPAALPLGVTQQITRSADDDGNDTLHGAMRVTFQPGVRSQTVHLPFCPPLPAAPNVMAGVLDGPSATVKTVESQTFGCSLEIRLASKTADWCEVVLEFFASASRAQEVA